jgi:hypothetical protein
LVAESELNRPQLIGEVAALTADFRAFTNRAKSLSSIASSAAVLVAAVSAFRRVKSVSNGAKPSWLQSALKGAGMISTLWLAFRPQGRQQETPRDDQRDGRGENIEK